MNLLMNSDSSHDKIILFSIFLLKKTYKNQKKKFVMFLYEENIKVFGL